MCQVLGDTNFTPPDAAGMEVTGFPGLGTLKHAQQITAFAIFGERYQAGGTLAQGCILLQAPSAQVTADGNDTRLDPLGDPGAVYEIADLRIHAHQVACVHADMPCIDRIHSDRILVTDLVQPFCVGAARVDQRGQTEIGQQDHFSFSAVDDFRVHMTLHTNNLPSTDLPITFSKAR
jgi:hypothetical protein